MSVGHVQLSNTIRSIETIGTYYIEEFNKKSVAEPPIVLLPNINADRLGFS